MYIDTRFSTLSGTSFRKKLKFSTRTRIRMEFDEDENVGPDVVLVEEAEHVSLDNGIVQVTISKPGGLVTGISYGGIENLLEYNNKETNRGYWDMNWSFPAGSDHFYVVYGQIYAVVHQDASRVEVSFARFYSPSTGEGVPLNIDKRFVLLRGRSGFYSYGIYERPDGWPAFNLNQTRITFKLSNDKFRHMAVADDKQRLMPSPEDLMPGRSEQLAYPEAHRLTDPIEPELLGEVDDKYQYSEDNQDLRVHGWLCLSADPIVGFWIITPSDEFRNGGPTKQNLTSHVGPTCLSMFHSAHYAGIDLCPNFQQGEAWEKVFGPVYIYLNAAQIGTPSSLLWQNAKAQAITEMWAWPYFWPASPAYPGNVERGALYGQLSVSELGTFRSGEFAYLGLALPGEVGSWQRESKGYQFWTRADIYGRFLIKDIRAGIYDLYGWVPGVMGDFKFDNGPIQISPGSVVNLGAITYNSPRDGPTVWEIGYPDRTAKGFYVPDPDPDYVNKLYINSNEKWRQYGLWERYTQLYPDQDLVYIVGQSDWRKDWFFAQTNRRMSDGSWVPTTWQVQFNLSQVSTDGVYKLRIATAASHVAALQVHVNDINSSEPIFNTLQFGRENAIARHGIHGLYKLWTIDVDSKLLHVGQNTFFLTQRKTDGGPFNGIMYDYLRLEAPLAFPKLKQEST